MGSHVIPATASALRDLADGISQIAVGIQLRSAGKDARELLHSAA